MSPSGAFSLEPLMRVVPSFQLTALYSLTFQATTSYAWSRLIATVKVHPLAFTVTVPGGAAANAEVAAHAVRTSAPRSATTRVFISRLRASLARSAVGSSRRSWVLRHVPCAHQETTPRPCSAL